MADRRIELSKDAIVRVEAQAGGLYRVVDSATGKTPGNLRIARQGDDLILIDPDLNAELTIEGFWLYADSDFPASLALDASSSPFAVATANADGQLIVSAADMQLDPMLAAQIGSVGVATLDAYDFGGMQADYGSEQVLGNSDAAGSGALSHSWPMWAYLGTAGILLGAAGIYSVYKKYQWDDNEDGTISYSGDARAVVGNTLNVKVSDKEGVGSVRYEWFRNGELIEGANGSSYTLTSQDAGKYIQAVAKYQDGDDKHEVVVSKSLLVDSEGGSLRLNYGDSEFVAGRTYVATPTVSGAAIGADQFAYQWYFVDAKGNSHPIPGANHSSYTAKDGDAGVGFFVVASHQSNLGSFIFSSNNSQGVSAPIDQNDPAVEAAQARLNAMGVLAGELKEAADAVLKDGIVEFQERLNYRGSKAELNADFDKERLAALEAASKIKDVSARREMIDAINRAKLPEDPATPARNAGRSVDKAIEKINETIGEMEKLNNHADPRTGKLSEQDKQKFSKLRNLLKDVKDYADQQAELDPSQSASLKAKIQSAFDKAPNEGKPVESETEVAQKAIEAVEKTAAALKKLAAAVKSSGKPATDEQKEQFKELTEQLANEQKTAENAINAIKDNGDRKTAQTKLNDALKDAPKELSPDQPADPAVQAARDAVDQVVAAVKKMNALRAGVGKDGPTDAQKKEFADLQKEYGDHKAAAEQALAKLPDSKGKTELQKALAQAEHDAPKELSPDQPADPAVQAAREAVELVKETADRLKAMKEAADKQTDPVTPKQLADFEQLSKTYSERVKAAEEKIKGITDQGEKQTVQSTLDGVTKDVPEELVDRPHVQEPTAAELAQAAVELVKEAADRLKAMKDAADKQTDPVMPKQLADFEQLSKTYSERVKAAEEKIKDVTDQGEKQTVQSALDAAMKDVPDVLVDRPHVQDPTPAELAQAAVELVKETADRLKAMKADADKQTDPATPKQIADFDSLLTSYNALVKEAKARIAEVTDKDAQKTVQGNLDAAMKDVPDALVDTPPSPTEVEAAKTAIGLVKEAGEKLKKFKDDIDNQGAAATGKQINDFSALKSDYDKKLSDAQQKIKAVKDEGQREAVEKELSATIDGVPASLGPTAQEQAVIKEAQDAVGALGDKIASMNELRKVVLSKGGKPTKEQIDQFNAIHSGFERMGSEATAKAGLVKNKLKRNEILKSLKDAQEQTPDSLEPSAEAQNVFKEAKAIEDIVASMRQLKANFKAGGKRATEEQVKQFNDLNDQLSAAQKAEDKAWEGMKNPDEKNAVKEYLNQVDRSVPASLEADPAHVRIADDGRTVTGLAGPNAHIVVTDAKGALLGEGDANGSGEFKVVLEQRQDVARKVRVQAKFGDRASDSVDSNDVAMVDAPTDVLISKGARHLTGKATPGANVKAVDSDGREIAHGVADSKGQFEFVLKEPVAPGKTVSVTAELRGVTSEATASNEAVAVDRPTDVHISADGRTITGKATPMNAIAVMGEDGKELGEGSADASGNFRLVLRDGNAVTKGGKVRVVAKSNGQSSESVDSNTVPDGDAPTNVRFELGGYVVSGRSTPGARVSITSEDGDKVLGSGVADSNGCFSVALSERVSEGQTLKAVAEANGKSSEPAQFTATGAEAPTDLHWGWTQPSPTAGGALPILIGRARPNASIHVMNEQGESVGGAQADSLGNFRVILRNGVHLGETVKVSASTQGEEKSDFVWSDPLTSSPAPWDVQLLDSGRRITGKAAPNTEIVVEPSVADEGYLTARGYGRADSDGNFEVVLDHAVWVGETVHVSAVSHGFGPSPDAVQVTRWTECDAPTDVRFEWDRNHLLLSGKAGPDSEIYVIDDSGNIVGQGSVYSQGHFELLVDSGRGKACKVVALPRGQQPQDFAGDYVWIDIPAYEPFYVHDLKLIEGGKRLACNTTPNSEILVYDSSNSEIARGWSNNDGYVELPVRNGIAPGSRVLLKPGDSFGSEQSVWSEPLKSPFEPTDLFLSSDGSVSGKAFMNAQISVLDASGQEVGRGRAGVDGRFKIFLESGAPDGQIFEVRAKGEDFQFPWPSEGKAYTNAYSSLEAPVDVHLSPSGMLTGKAAPHCKIVVQGILDRGTLSRETETDESGDFSLNLGSNSLPRGLQVKVTAKDDRYHSSDPALSNAYAELEAPTDVHFSMDGKYLVGKAVPHANVRLYGRSFGGNDSAVADNNGDFAIPLNNGMVSRGEKVKVTAELKGRYSEATESNGYADLGAPTELHVSAGGKTLTGKTLPGATVHAYCYSNNNHISENAVADDFGNFKIDFRDGLPLGEKLEVIAELDGIHSSAAYSNCVVAVDAPTEVRLSSDGLTVTGKAAPHVRVYAFDQYGRGVYDEVAEVDATGHFEIKLRSRLPEGQRVKVVAEDGTPYGRSDEVFSNAFGEAEAPSWVYIKADGKTVTGKAEPAARIVVKGMDGSELGSGIVDPQGAFSIELSQSVAVGQTVKAIVRTDNGKASASVKSNPVYDVDAPTEARIASDGQTVSGSAAPDVDVVAYAVDGRTVLGTGRSGSDGTFSFKLDSELPVGAKVKVLAKSGDKVSLFAESNEVPASGQTGESSETAGSETQGGGEAVESNSGSTEHAPKAEGGSERSESSHAAGAASEVGLEAGLPGVPDSETKETRPAPSLGAENRSAEALRSDSDETSAVESSALGENTESEEAGAAQADPAGADGSAALGASAATVSLAEDSAGAGLKPTPLGWGIADSVNLATDHLAPEAWNDADLEQSVSEPGVIDLARPEPGRPALIQNGVEPEAAQAVGEDGQKGKESDDKSRSEDQVFEYGVDSGLSESSLGIAPIDQHGQHGII